MRRISKEWLALIIIGVLTIIVGIFQWNQTPIRDQAPAETIQDRRIEKEEGEVAVVVEYLKDKSTADNMVFQIALDTHSVNLDGLDFQKDVILEKDGKILKPLQLGQSGSVHHRKAELTFAKVTAPATVVVMNLSGIPRREFKFTNL